MLLVQCALLFARAGSAQQIEEGRYVVGRGETLSEIAERMHITTRVLAEYNHLQAPYALRSGRRLRVPPEVTDEVYRQLGGVVRTRGTAAATASANASANSRTTTTSATNGSRASASNTRGNTRGNASGGGRYGRPASRGYVRLVRESTGAMMDLHMRRITASVQTRMRTFLRYGDGRSRAIHPRLLRQLALVSDHFGGRRIHVISGYRPFRRGQWTPHSNHNIGRAVDFRVEGVSNRALRDYCRTIPQTGCGYYPRSVFVHMDVREESATWVDWSRPGQRPMYGREDRAPDTRVAATATAAARASEDEGVDDVAQDNHRVREATAVEEHDDDERARRESGSGETTAPAATPGAATGAGAAAGGAGAAAAN